MLLGSFARPPFYKTVTSIKKSHLMIPFGLLEGNTEGHTRDPMANLVNYQAELGLFRYQRGKERVRQRRRQTER